MKRKLTKPQSLLLLLIAVVSNLFSPSAGADTLTPGQPLVGSQTLVSAGGRFEFGFFSPANSNSRYVGIWYHNVSTQTVVWVANRANPIVAGVGNVSIDGKGTIFVVDQNATVVWSSATSPGSVNPVAQLLDSGNLIVKEANGSSGDVAWQSFDHPTDTVLPDMKFGWNPAAGLRNLTAWASPSDPAPSEYFAEMDISGYPQITLWGGSRVLWRSGPWNGLRFSGVPEQMNVNMFTFVFVANPDEIYYMVKMRDPSILFRIIVNESGTTQGLVWIEQSQIWNLFWSAPKDQCDAAAPCGPFGVCNPNDWPICHCIQGFQPENPTNWALRDGSNGCTRKSSLDCRNGTDGFVTVSGAKLPDTSNSTVDMSLSLAQCRANCLRKCSCTGYASANISSGIGCIFWFTDMVGIREYTMDGQDLYVRVAAADLGSGSNHPKWSVIVSAVIGCGAGVSIIALVSCFIWKRRNKRRRALLGSTISFSEHGFDDHKEGKDLDLPLYDLEAMVCATDNFSLKNKLGEGGFGPVYKGILGDEQEIAVKRLAKTSVQGVDEFKNEVMLIAKLQHRNLVRLLGCCIQGEERMLIYEYMYNKSLDAFLFGDKAKSAQLDWQTRYNIIIGVARGLLYLHQDSRFRIIHRDLKASNILLDKDMNPKISDFGMARIFGGDETEVNTRRVVGTYGYMSPEYAMDGVFSVKSDVFSFGVLVLEIISGKRNRGVYHFERNSNLLGHAWSLWKEGNGLELVDQSIGFSYPMAEVLRCVKVGLLCVQERPEDRPTMSSVVLMLSSESSILPQPKQPGFVATKGPSETDSSSSKQNTVSANEISVTMFEGR